MQSRGNAVVSERLSGLKFRQHHRQTQADQTIRDPTLEQEEEKEDTQVILSSSRKTLPYCRKDLHMGD